MLKNVVNVHDITNTIYYMLYNFITKPPSIQSFTLIAKYSQTHSNFCFY